MTEPMPPQIVDVRLRQHAARFPEHQPGAGGEVAERAVEESARVHDGGERHQGANPGSRARAQHADGASHAVSGVSERSARQGIQHRPEILDLLRDVRVFEAPLRRAVAGERDPQRRDPRPGQALGEGDQEGAVLVRGHAVADDHDRAVGLGSRVIGVVEALAGRIADDVRHGAHAGTVDLIAVTPVNGQAARRAARAGNGPTAW